MFREARKDFTQGNIAYLRRKADRPPITLGANTNGKHCTRVSCQYASGIYVCNDNDHDVQVALGTVADYAQAVLDDPRKECNWHEEYYEGGGDAEDVTWGQAFDANGWYVLVPPPSMILYLLPWVVCICVIFLRVLWSTMLTLEHPLGTSLLACGTLMKSVRNRSTIAREIERKEDVWWC